MKFLIVFSCLLFSGYCYSQNNMTIRFVDDEGKTVREKKSVYLIRQQKTANNSWQVDRYNTDGPLIKSETFSDEKLSVRNGRFTWYDARGRIDSTGIYTNNQKDKSWYYYKKTDSLQVSKEFQYDKGKLIKVIDFAVQKPEAIDTAGKNAHESEFPGAAQGWLNYLVKILRYPDRAVEMEKMGTVTTLFIITKNGQVEDPFLYRSVEMSLDDEALRVIKATPTWTPATLNGEKVDSYKLQPITFRLSVQ